MMEIDSSDSNITPYGFLPSKLSTAKLSELCFGKNGIQTGPFGSQLHNKDYVSEGTPIITVEHLGENKILHENIPFVTERDRLRLQKYSLKQGDIVFSRVGSVDRRAIVREENEGWLFSGRCLRVRPDHSKINPEYLSYFFGWNPFKEYIRNIAVGATMPSLNTKILSDIPIFYPPLPEQRAIANILSSLDDKIELNTRMNKTLEAMAQALFRSWFVDFDPVRAKMAGREPEGMDAETAALFPDEMEVCDGREVPNGWKVEEIRSLRPNIQYGFTQSASNDPIGPKFLRITDIRGGEINWDNVPYCKISSEEQQKYAIKNGDIFVARTGASTGENVYIIDAQESIFASYLVRFRFKSPEISRLVAEFMRSESYFYSIEASLGGSAQPNASAQVLASPKFVYPTQDVAETFFKIVSPLDMAKAKNQRESRILTALRDTLLPKLISGEIRVRGIA